MKNSDVDVFVIVIGSIVKTHLSLTKMVAVAYFTGLEFM